jgi:hypothetical protein
VEKLENVQFLQRLKVSFPTLIVFDKSNVFTRLLQSRNAPYPKLVGLLVIPVIVVRLEQFLNMLYGNADRLSGNEIVCKLEQS